MRTLVLSLVTALALAGCSSGTASQLTYTDPTSTGWRLVKDPSSTASRLVLALIGPSGTKVRGVGFNLQAGSAARWSTFANGLPIENTGVLELQNTTPPFPYDELLLNGGVMDGNVLTVGIFQKDRRVTDKDASKPLLRIAIEIDPKAQSGAIPLKVRKAKILPGDIGAYTDDALTIVTKTHLDPIDIAVGTLQAG